MRAFLFFGVLAWANAGKLLPLHNQYALVVELVDTPDLGSGVARLGGSSPFARTEQGSRLIKGGFFLIEI